MRRNSKVKSQRFFYLFLFLGYWLSLQGYGIATLIIAKIHQNGEAYPLLDQPLHMKKLQDFSKNWIPYQLKEDANVIIRIYSSSGMLVRTLNLGYKPAGFYDSKERSAHWDGRNETGERVASGIYFYTIQAGNFTDTRKLVILR